MKYKKFLLIPVLIYVYMFYIVDFLVSFNPMIYEETTTSVPSGPGQPITVGESISVVVTRSYFFGIIELPVYTNYMGYIGDYHQAFFYLVGILTVAFVIIELIGKRGQSKERNERREKMKKLDMKGLAKAIGYGLVFWFVVFTLSGDGGVSLGLGLLLMYLEYKLNKLK